MIKLKTGQLLLIEHFAGSMAPPASILKEYIEEMADTGKLSKPVVVVGLVQAADKKNQNNRIYPYDVLHPEVERYKNDVIGNKAGNVAIGELDHVDEPIIHLAKTSHVMDDIWWDGPQKKDVWGKVKLIPTHNGTEAEKIVLSGVPLGISSRAIGSVDEKHDANYVKDDLQLICWDLVGTPSTNQAYLKMYESKETMVKEAISKVSKRKIILNDILKNGGYGR